MERYQHQAWGSCSVWFWLIFQKILAMDSKFPYLLQYCMRFQERRSFDNYCSGSSCYEGYRLVCSKLYILIVLGWIIIIYNTTTTGATDTGAT
jgi:hypothetical protein